MGGYKSPHAPVDQRYHPRIKHEYSKTPRSFIRDPEFVDGGLKSPHAPVDSHCPKRDLAGDKSPPQFIKVGSNRLGTPNPQDFRALSRWL
jgi:hypothetical protein